jgi:hypothetical protein
MTARHRTLGNSAAGGVRPPFGTKGCLFRSYSAAACQRIQVYSTCSYFMKKKKVSRHHS